MNAVRLLAIGAIVCLLGSVALADEKKKGNAKLVLGKWEVAASHEGGPPKGGTVEFTKDGKLKVAGEQNGQKMEFDGTYKVDGDKLTLTFKFGENETPVNLTIEKLDETTFITKSEHGKVELKRKK
jgi:uncharacterized protein (TIGR03066 family)